MASRLEGLAYDEEALESFCRRWGVSELAVFGSAARGELRPDSDVDIAVRFGPGSKVGLWDFVTMKDELAELFRRPVDLLERDSIRNPFRKRSIERDLTVIYAAPAMGATTS